MIDFLKSNVQQNNFVTSLSKIFNITKKFYEHMYEPDTGIIPLNGIKFICAK